MYFIIYRIIFKIIYIIYLYKPLAKPQNKATYSYGGNTFNSSGYLVNPSRSAQIQARDAGALTNYEARQMGLHKRR